MFFMMLGLNKETDPTKLSPVKRHKFLTSILCHVYPIIPASGITERKITQHRAITLAKGRKKPMEVLFMGTPI